MSAGRSPYFQVMQPCEGNLMNTPYYGSNPIRALRERALMTQEDLALQSGLTQQYLDGLEKGHERRWKVRLGPLAAMLNVPIKEIIAA
jgi:transcriptional regulator with XRE-family HTH domain